MKFEYVNKHGVETWWVNGDMVPKVVYDNIFQKEHPKKVDMTCVGFEDMIRLISDGDMIGYFKTPYKTYRFYAEKDMDFNDIIIKVQFDDEDVEFGDFFQEYEYISDWINYKFTVKPVEQWIECDFKHAHKLYESGIRVRCEVDGVVEEFNKTSRELRGLIDVVVLRQLGGNWEYLV